MRAVQNPIRVHISATLHLRQPEYIPAILSKIHGAVMEMSRSAWWHCSTKHHLVQRFISAVLQYLANLVILYDGCGFRTWASRYGAIQGIISTVSRTGADTGNRYPVFGRGPF